MQVDSSSDDGLIKIVGFSIPSEGAITTSLNLAVRNLLSSQNVSFEQYTKLQLDSIREAGDIESNNSTTLGGNPAHKVVYTNSEGVKTMQIWTIQDNTAYHVLFTVEEEKYFQYLPIYEMVGSLEIGTLGYR